MSATALRHRAGLGIGEAQAARDLAHAEKALEKAVGPILAGPGEVIAGPWIAEVGFEVLYWIPFLRQLVATYRIDPGRITVVSRGGTASWYEGVCGRYVELFDAVDMGEFRRHTEALWSDLGERKQIEVTAWDERLLDAALGTEWRTKALVHPSLMRAVFRPWWRDEVPVEYAVGHLRAERLAAPVSPMAEAALPERFVAARFYHRASFPPEHRAFAVEIVRRLAARIPVVLLVPGLDVDDHADADLREIDSVLPLGGFAPATNLHEQSAVIARSSLFVGTYGGLSYLAPLYGVPSLGLASLPEHTSVAHLELAHRILDSEKSPLVVVDPGTFAAIDAVWLGDAP